uniref:Uncharacterized protein n=1 Tax=Anguilla anguilla TaxID=7936 RepID=A0A0E9UJN3_ANGAN
MIETDDNPSRKRRKKNCHAGVCILKGGSIWDINSTSPRVSKTLLHPRSVKSGSNLVIRNISL